MAQVNTLHTRGFGSTTAVAIGLLMVVSLPGPAHADPCGLALNGPNWVSQCVSQLDSFVSNAWITLRIDGIIQPQIHVHGGTVIDRRARDPMGPVLDTEIVSMNLQGGGFTITEPLERSLGQVTQNPDGITATGFFDVFFELAGPFPFGPLHNADPARVVNSELLYLPPVVDPGSLPSPPVDPDDLPGFPYVYDCIVTGACVTLFDRDNIPRAEIVSIIHLPKVPEPSSLLLLGAGLVGLAKQIRRRRMSDGRRIT